GKLISTGVIDGGDRQPLLRHRVETEGGRRPRPEDFVHPDIRRRRVVHRDQPRIVEVERLPQLLGDGEKITPVDGAKQLPRDLYIVGALVVRGDLSGREPKTEGAAPEDVGHEAI